MLQPLPLQLLRLMISCLWNDLKRLAFMDYLLTPCECISKSGNSVLLHQSRSQAQLLSLTHCYNYTLLQRNSEVVGHCAMLFSPWGFLVAVFVSHKLRESPDSSPGGCLTALGILWPAGNRAAWTDSGSQPATALTDRECLSQVQWKTQWHGDTCSLT